ncbi:unnamed protein product [Cuscuta epithymum]|uniref:Uncharacterized protein n=1 Tax=Cuscuta epithymum TaxID=186058 RepID=A0AAV0F8H1_9ASTE|nr:unnamed protein product [Cuscuta epithymum]
MKLCYIDCILIAGVHVEKKHMKMIIIRLRECLQLLKKKHFSAFGFKKHLFTKHYQFLLFLGLRVKSVFPFSITQKTLILPNTTNFYFSKSLFSQTLSTFTTNHFFLTSPKVLFFKQKQLQTLPKSFTEENEDRSPNNAIV